MTVHAGDLLAVHYFNRVLVGKATLISASRILIELIEPIEEFGKKLSMLSIHIDESEILFKI